MRVIKGLRWLTSAPEIKPSVTPVRRRPSFDFSLTGLIYCSMMMFMGLAAVSGQVNLLFAVFGLMVGVLIVSGVISRMVLRGLQIQRHLPEHAVVGEIATIGYEFANRKMFWPSLSVSLAELDGVEGFIKQPQAYALHAAPRSSALVPIEVIPKRRGLYELNSFQLATSFPFGFIKRAITQKMADHVLIFPAIAHVSQKVLNLCQSAEKVGPSVRPRRGGADEIYGVKEYRRGENQRLIYWKRSARTGTLVSKEMTQVTPPRLMLFVDTHLPQRTLAEQVKVEQTIAMAASMISFALEHELMVGLCVWAGQWVTIPPNRGKRQRRDLLSALARLPLNQTTTTRQLLEQGQEMMESGTTGVLLTPGATHGPTDANPRGHLVVLSPSSAQHMAWFKFPPSVNFEWCMPVDQQPEES